MHIGAALLKEFRSLIQMLDDLDDPAPLPRPPVEPVAVELPQSVETVARPAGAASTFIFDSDPNHAGLLAATLQRSGVDSEIFTDTPQFMRGLLTREPSMVFLEVSGPGDAAIDALFAMGGRNYSGGVQLMGADEGPVMDVVRRMGDRHSLKMLPTLRKPLEPRTVRGVLVSQNFPVKEAPTASLAEALHENWVEFWYQPKIDLKKRQIAGVETFARIRHPELGTVQPTTFMHGATEADLVRLSEKALRAALKAASDFANVGINLRVAVNIPVRALFDLNIGAMAQAIGPQTPRWPGLVLDVTAAQLAADFDRVAAMAVELSASNVRLAIDDFGRASLPMTSLTKLPLAELKLDRNFVQGSATDQGRAKLCAGVINLAHHLACVAVGVGIERPEDLKLLASLGCDVGQGYLFGPPMPEQELVGLLLKRAVGPSASAPAPQPAPAANVQPLPPRQAQAQREPRQLKRSVWN